MTPNETGRENMSNNVAQTILAQLGGGKFLAMTGAKNLIAHESALSFKLPAGTSRDGSNYIKITLTAMDDYQIETLGVRGLKVTPKSFREGVYADNLQAVFTSVTGLDTSLGTMGR